MKESYKYHRSGQFTSDLKYKLKELIYKSMKASLKISLSQKTKNKWNI